MTDTPQHVIDYAQKNNALAMALIDRYIKYIGPDDQSEFIADVHALVVGVMQNGHDMLAIINELDGINRRNNHAN